MPSSPSKVENAKLLVSEMTVGKIGDKGNNFGKSKWQLLYQQPIFSARALAILAKIRVFDCRRQFRQSFHFQQRIIGSLPRCLMQSSPPLSAQYAEHAAEAAEAAKLFVQIAHVDQC